MSKETEKEPSLADIDPMFADALKEKHEALKKPKSAEVTPAPKKVEVSEADRVFLDLLGAYGGERLARAMDAGVRRLPEPAAAPMRSAGFTTAGMGTPAAPRAPVAPALPQVAPPAGGPAGPVGGPASVVRVPQPLGVPGTYPTATGPGSATFNYGRAYGLPEIEAGRAMGTGKAPGEVWSMLENRQQGLNRIQQMGGGFTENPRFGGLMTPEQSVGSGPRSSFVQQPGGGIAPIPTPKPVPTAASAPGALDRFLMAGKGVGKAVMGSPFVSGVLGGLSTAEGVQEFMKRQAEGDVPGQIMAGAGALGGMTAMAPHPLAKIIGGSLSAASPLTLYLYDKIRNRPPEPLKPRVPEPGTNLPPTQFIPR